MNFKHVTIKNFRNFKEIETNLANKNIFFGMNDVGKTNFLYALMFIFDKNRRQQGLLETDFYRHDTEIPIEIVVCLHLNDENYENSDGGGEDEDTDKLRARVRGLLDDDVYDLYIKLVAEYDVDLQVAEIKLFWGGDEDSYQEIPHNGKELDKVFNVVYIDAYVDMHRMFQKDIVSIFKKEASNETEETQNKIKDIVKQLNDEIGNLEKVKHFQDNIKDLYLRNNQELQIKILSELAANSIYDKIFPYMQLNGDDKVYPTSGAGRRKLLVYAMYEFLLQEKQKERINLYMIEEPENNLHPSMQKALSRKLFENKYSYRYLFMTTHSSYMLTDMDNVNMVRIFNENKVNVSSYFYQLGEEFATIRKKINSRISEAIFADRVLMVEGPSEEILFDAVLNHVVGDYLMLGIYILPVNGINFQIYRCVLNGLKIFTCIKTDNDLQKVNNTKSYMLLGFSRCNGLIKTCEGFLNEDLLPEERIASNAVKHKRALYKNNKEAIENMAEKYAIYLSEVDLENDLNKVINLKSYNTTVSKMQKKKQYNMVELINLINQREDAEKVYKGIYEHDLFACVRRMVEKNGE